MKKYSKNRFFTLVFIWIVFITCMSLSVLNRIIDTYTYLLYSFVLLYIFYIYKQILK
jgi:hypothetical protein